jgi:hypothetical protein
MPANGQNSYFVGGICVPTASIALIEQKLVSLAHDVFKSYKLEPQTEFHASFIYQGKGPFKGKPAQERIDLILKLADVLAEPSIKRVFVEIVTTRIKYGIDPGETAFMFFCEQVQNLLSPGNHHTILIGDQDDEHMKQTIRSFFAYRLASTYWQFGIKIENIVDTVHFARSHHSRLVQLADAYVFIVSHLYTTSRKGWMAEKLRTSLQQKFMPMAHKMREWPSGRYG